MKTYKGSVLQFDQNYQLVNSYAGELKKILSEIQNGDKYYYRFPCFADIGTRKKIKYSHFGVNGVNQSCNYYSAEELVQNCLNHKIQTYYRRIKQNRDYHIDFEDFLFVYTIQLQAAERLKRNCSSNFNERLNSFLKRHPEFIEVLDLTAYRGVSGLYILVLDDYNVCYIGQTQSSIMSRIKQHWTRSDYYLRGIDRFKSMDTTRIYVYPLEGEDAINEAEYRLVSDFPEQYSLNQSMGGDVYFESEQRIRNIEPDENGHDCFNEYWEKAADILGITCE